MYLVPHTTGRFSVDMLTSNTATPVPVSFPSSRFDMASTNATVCATWFALLVLMVLDCGSQRQGQCCVCKDLRPDGDHCLGPRYASSWPIHPHHMPAAFVGDSVINPSLWVNVVDPHTLRIHVQPLHHKTDISEFILELGRSYTIEILLFDHSNNRIEQSPVCHVQHALWPD